MLPSNCPTLEQVLQADIKLQPQASDILRPFEGLRGCDVCTQSLNAGEPYLFFNESAEVSWLVCPQPS